MQDFHLFHFVFHEIKYFSLLSMVKSPKTICIYKLHSETPLDNLSLQAKNGLGKRFYEKGHFRPLLCLSNVRHF